MCAIEFFLPTEKQQPKKKDDRVPHHLPNLITPIAVPKKDIGFKN